MRLRNTTSLAVLAGLCLIPAAAVAQSAPAQDTNSTTAQITIGGQYVGGSNTGIFGRYNGFTEQGFDTLGSFSVEKRDPNDSFYYSVTGTNLDLQTGSKTSKNFGDKTYKNDLGNTFAPEGSVNVQAGDQGKWGVDAGYDAITYTGNQIQSLYTINPDNPVAALNGSLVPYGGASNNPLTKGTITSYNTTTLLPNFDTFQTGTRRDIFHAIGKYLFGDWTVTAAVRHQHKHGSLEESFYGTWGGMAFALPVDTDTDTFNVSAAYNTPTLQAMLEYTFSKFTQNDAGVVLRSPVSVATLSASSGPYAQAAYYSEMPSNAAHYFTGMLGYQIAPQTRFTVNARVGLELQDDSFGPINADPNLLPTLGSPTYNWFNTLGANNLATTASSPNMTATVYEGNASVTTQLLHDLEGRLAYSFDGRDVSVNQYLVWTGGHAPDTVSNTAYYVVPQEWLNQTGNLSLTYRLWPEHDTKLIFDYTYKNIDRTNAQVEHSNTNTESLLLTSMVTPEIMGRLSYAHADRSGTLVYGRAWGNINDGVPGLWDSPSGAYYQAPMTSDSVSFRTDYAPTRTVSAGIMVKYAHESFTYPTNGNPTTNPANWTLTGYGTGIKSDYNLSIGPDVSWRPSDTLSLHAYYTYEKIYYDNLGNGQCAQSNTGACAGSIGYFENTYDSSMHTAGFDGTWQMSDKVKLTGSYNYASGSVVFGEYNGVIVTTVTQSFQNVVSFPDINSTMHDLNLALSWQVLDNAEWSLIYRYDMFKNNDWDYVASPVIPNTPTSTGISIVNAGYGPPHYNVSTIGTLLSFRM